ncbi:LysR family transcriptional regulator [Roseobacter cerasinus]|uniref:LysR family transcriptional regulator n=1 Tax=Roseobacter cerasinus TaxID=2602289 RepID=A0A640VWQ4_9RHOB|nr:LysR substrate-binding domain-containing protein [Roseobacter cerasinus]GFE51810.1 LysR family transcriptional regulator [Roseobacter cerasinus]
MRHLKDYEFIEGVIRAGSIRKAAEDMHITASALNRRINRFEDEFGYEIFERLPRGVRLNPAGEMLLQFIRSQGSEFARLRSQVADLSGVRRGHVSVACSQALLPYFLPHQIAQYREDHPGVTFSVNARDRVEAERELAEFSSDLALVFEPQTMVDFEVVFAIAQPIHAVMRADHPLAEQPEVRLRDCLRHPHTAPSSKFAVRNILETASRRLSSISLNPMIESESFDFMRHYGQWEDMISFQFPIGLDLSGATNLVSRPLAAPEVPHGNLLLGQLRGRVLPVASARFAQQLVQSLQRLE